MDLQGKNIFIVLGMARSGTSAITRGLNALGVSLGEKLTPPNDKWNPKGFWENRDIVYNIHGKIFSELNFPIYNIQKLDRTLQLSTQLNSIRKSAIELLKQHFLTAESWGFKDPSTIKLLPFWQSIFHELKVNDHYIIALRNPLSVARSYHSLTGLDIEMGLLLWLNYLIEAVDETHEKKRIITNYELLLQNPKKELTRIQSTLHISSPSSNELDHYSNQFLDKKLNHFELPIEDLKSHSAMNFAPLCLDVHELLLRVAKDEILLTDNEFINTWQHIKNDLDKMYPFYCYVDTLLKKVNDLQRSLRTIHKSISWKMLFPIRKIDYILGAKRRQSREAKRLKKAYE
jgi:hypothetical protein